MVSAQHSQDPVLENGGGGRKGSKGAWRGQRDTLHVFEAPSGGQNGSPWLWLEVKKSDISPTSEDAWAERGP